MYLKACKYDGATRAFEPLKTLSSPRVKTTGCKNKDC